MKARFIFLFFVCSFAFSVLESPVLFASEMEPAIEADIREKAQKRLYPGGRDEEDLKVMSRVPEPLVKVYKKSVQDQVLKAMTSQEKDSSQEN